MTATVASLKFVMGADTAEFERAMKGVEGAMKRAAVVGSAVGVTIANSISGAFASIRDSIKETLKHADEMGKAAQKIGVPVEELSRLRHAAELSGVSFEQLQSAMGRFSRSMAQAASDAQSGAGRAFAAVGVAATDAAGKIRPSVDVIADIAGPFAAMQDGAGKTALAMELFGRSGAALIPMLNAGRDGIRALMNEADALGIVISNRTAQASERFNDNLERIGKIGSGIALKITAELLPALELLAAKFLEFGRNAENVKTVSDGINAVFGFIAKNAASLAVFFNILKNDIEALGRAFQAGLPFSRSFNDVLAANRTAAEAQIASLKGLWAEIDHATGSWRAHVETAPAVVASQAPVIASTRSIAEAMRALKDENLAAMDAIVNAPTETYLAKLEAVRVALVQTAINQRQYGQMVRKVEDENRGHIESTASLAASTLTTVFAKNKAAAIGAAIINTAVGITKALATLPPPFSFAQAALIAASGAAQIAAITSANSSGGGNKSPSVAGGGGGGGEDAGGGAPSQALSINLTGAGSYSPEQVKGLLEQINGAIQDGATLVATNIR